MRVLGIIPARYASSRFPGKPLAQLNGKPMIEVVYRRLRASSLVDHVIVATDDARIQDTVRSFGGDCVMTSPAHTSGTDRAAQVARDTKAEIVLNVQGDEPLLRSEQIDGLIEALDASTDTDAATLMTPFRDLEEFQSPDAVKVVTDLHGYAVYFSRAQIPYGAGALEPESWGGHIGPFKHIGIYAYRRDFLGWMARTEPTPLEKLEKLEQLRILEHGRKLKVVRTPHDTVSVDRPEDLDKVMRLLRGAR